MNHKVPNIGDIIDFTKPNGQIVKVCLISQPFEVGGGNLWSMRCKEVENQNIKHTLIFNEINGDLDKMDSTLDK